jgi:hypothetical protein
MEKENLVAKQLAYLARNSPLALKIGFVHKPVEFFCPEQCLDPPTAFAQQKDKLIDHIHLKYLHTFPGRGETTSLARIAAIFRPPPPVNHGALEKLKYFCMLDLFY